MSGLEDFARLVGGDHGLVVVSTLRADGTIQSSVVNAGVLPTRSPEPRWSAWSAAATRTG